MERDNYREEGTRMIEIIDMDKVYADSEFDVRLYEKARRVCMMPMSVDQMKTAVTWLNLAIKRCRVPKVTVPYLYNLRKRLNMKITLLKHGEGQLP